MENEYLKEFRTQSIAEITHLAYTSKFRVVVGVSLASGLYLEGSIIDIALNEKQGYNICFDQPQNGITYFSTNSIIAITIRQPLSTATIANETRNTMLSC
ncbi:hypothetical protein [Aquimarina sediminis]|uniref:hypothetical protein n=1 Tax=Aquimarina sediminis TaxID=2070536 RepID=UPI000CA04D82|nr:hypothetical protein [Aquimarina sediminis]